jgi:seryl-tRNA synthetase
VKELGLHWSESGQAGLSGPLLELADDCDHAFQILARRWRAREERHGSSLSAAELQRVGYLRSFPHQATFPIRLESDDENLAAFRDGQPVAASGEVVLTRTMPVSDVLTPAACYHLYLAHQNRSIDEPLYLTTRNTCFRTETHYVPLRRQWSFTMREIVCLGGPETVAAFLADARQAVDALLEAIDLPVSWPIATDPFFRPEQNPQYLMQRVAPTKNEASYDTLAIASLNLHHDHFGDAFGIRIGDRPAHSGCLAFGIERWLFAIVDRHGTDPARWPSPAKVAGQL